jgi:dienelactone hydrolase
VFGVFDDTILAAARPALATLGLFFICAAIWPKPVATGRAFMVAGSLALMIQYAWWRITDTLPAPTYTFEYVLALVFLIAELIGIVTAALSLLFLTRTRDRSPEADANAEWLSSQAVSPSIDVLICSYNCVAGARWLVANQKVDPERLMISGGSAGGYTTLCALTPKDDKVFSAGASYYGVSDLEALARDTHKFESHYLDWLIGPYPHDRDTYAERSPINHVDRLSAPVIFFQGAEARVVPPNQTELMVAALKKRGVPVGYLLFDGEQHGFRKAENIKRALDAELYFYAMLILRSGLRF